MKRLLGVLLAGTLVLGGLAGCASAEFEVSPLTITPSQVVAGESLTVSAEITNVGGADGVYAAKLTVNGTEVATKDIAVAAGVTEQVSFTLTEETPGSYDVTLNDMKASFTVLKLPSAQEIVDGVIEALDDISSYEFEMDISLDGTGEVEGEPIEATMTLAASGALDPENRQMRFDMTVNVAPWFGDEMAMAAETYLIDNMAYMMTDFPETGPMWRKEEVPEAYLEQMSEQFTTLTGPHTELLQAAQVTVIGSEKVKGVDCYVLQLTPDVHQLWQWVMQQTVPGMLLTGEEILPYEDQIAQGFLQEKLSFSVKQWVAKDTYFLIRAEIDMAIELTPEALGAEEEEVQVNIDFNMSYLAYNYNQPISIVVPPEAEAAVSASQAVPVEPPPAPSPISPEEGAVLDNGRTDGLDDIAWHFDWSPIEGASLYHLYVIGHHADIPLIDEYVASTSYDKTGTGYIAHKHRLGWTWKVRAKVGDQWGSWSETRTFDVEPLNSDPPAPAELSWYEERGYEEKEPYTGDCAKRPEGTVCLSFSDGYIWLITDSVAGWEELEEGDKKIVVAIGFKARYYHVLDTKWVKEERLE